MQASYEKECQKYFRSFTTGDTDNSDDPLEAPLFSDLCEPARSILQSKTQKIVAKVIYLPKAIGENIWQDFLTEESILVVKKIPFADLEIAVEPIQPLKKRRFGDEDPMETQVPASSDVEMRDVETGNNIFSAQPNKN